MTARCADPPPQQGCDITALSRGLPCDPHTRTKIISIVWGALCLVYFCIYMFFNVRASMRLSRLPYVRYRTGNLLQNWQVRSSTLTFCWPMQAVAIPLMHVSC